MDRITKNLHPTGGLAFAILFGLAHADVPKAYKMGTVASSRGSVTFLPYAPTSPLQSIQTGSIFLSDGTYEIKGDSLLSAKLFEGGVLRAHPDTRFALEYRPESKSAVILLFTGSVKVDFSNDRLQKFTVKTFDTTIETSGARMSVVRNRVVSSVGLYVEQGVATVIRNEGQRSPLAYVHALEMVWIEDAKTGIPGPRKIKEKELKFIQDDAYLKFPSTP